jgi:hypothetical protein
LGNSIGETTDYLDAILAGRLPVPDPIAWQVDRIASARESFLSDAT